MSSIFNAYLVDDPILDWRYVPNSETKIGRIVNTYNSAGFRDREHSIQKPPGIKRILVVGDSVTEGHGVDWDSVFSSILQSRLGNGYEVITMGMGGLNTPQEIHLLEKEGLVYEPDLVVLNFVLNDCDFYTRGREVREYLSQKDAEIGLFNLPVNPRFKRALKSSAFIYFLKERIEFVKGRFFGTEETDYFVNIWKKQENRQKVTTGFDKLRTLQSDKHFDVLVMIWPLITDYKDRSYKFDYIHHWVQDEAKKRGFKVMDLLSRFSEIPYRDLQITPEDNLHPSALGHKMGAEAFLETYGL